MLKPTTTRIPHGADNYDPAANNDDGSFGANNDDGSCIISGCTNPNSENYNPAANNDDGSCGWMHDAGADNYDAVNRSVCAMRVRVLFRCVDVQATRMH